jgi:hypothetical protein
VEQKTRRAKISLFMKDFQILHRANGIARINQCIFACKLAPVETGTFYSKRFKK